MESEFAGCSLAMLLPGKESKRRVLKSSPTMEQSYPLRQLLLHEITVLKRINKKNLSDHSVAARHLSKLPDPPVLSLLSLLG